MKLMRPGALEWCPIDDLLLVVVAIRVGAATVAVVDETGGGHPVGLRETGKASACARWQENV